MEAQLVEGGVENTDPEHLAALAVDLSTEPPAPKHKRKKSKSPTQRSLEHWRAKGYVCAIVEHWNPWVRIRQDLYGFIDVLAIKDEDIVGIQACSGTDVSKRVTKIVEHANYPLVTKALRIVVQGWRKNAARKWMLREVEL